MCMRAIICGFLLANAAVANARPLSLRLSLEPGVSALTVPAGTSHTLAGGATLALGITDLAWMQLRVSDTPLHLNGPHVRATTWVGSLLYTIDLLSVTPFVELGIGWVRLRGSDGGAELAPELGVGVDKQLLPWVSAGVVVRYTALVGSTLLDAPASALLQARLSVLLFSAR